MSEEILRRYKIKAKKALWQNFLVNEDIIGDIAHWIDTTDKNIIEVWSGYWALTQKLLLQNLESLTLVELDTRMVEILENRIALGELESGNTNFEIINKDVLQYIPEFTKYSVIANIPYYITSPILRHFLYKLENKPDEMVILMQKDVGDKILDIFKEGKKQKSSVIWLMMAKKSYVSELMLVWKQNFIPAPNVESSVLLFESHNSFSEVNDEIFLRYVKIWFSSARKKLIKNLVAWWLDKERLLIVFEKLKISEWMRWEGLNIQQWCDLVWELEKINK